VVMLRVLCCERKEVEPVGGRGRGRCSGWTRRCVVGVMPRRKGLRTRILAVSMGLGSIRTLFVPFGVESGPTSPILVDF